MRKKDRRQKDKEWKDCERVDGKEGKININTHLEGWREDSNDFVIFFREEPSSEQIELMAERAKLFEKTRPYKYLDEDFKFLGIEVLQITTVTKRKGYDKY